MTHQMVDGRSKITMTTKSLLKSLFCVCGSTSSSSNENVQDSSRSPMTTALGIHLILKKILENLDTCDLLTCRLVNSSWNNLVSTLQPCQSERSLPFQLYFRYRNGHYILHQKYPTMAPRTFPQFLNLLENSLKHHTLFPVHYISFKFYGGRLNDPELQHLLTRFGERLVNLQLELAPFSENGQSGTTTLVHSLLTNHLANGHVLNLPPSMLIDPWNQPTFSSTLMTFTVTLPSVLPNLVVIKGTEIPAQIMEKLVTYCPNLRSISFSLEIHTLPFLQFLMTSQKLGLIKNFVFRLFPVKMGRFDFEQEEEQKWYGIFNVLEKALALNLRPSTLRVNLERLGSKPNILNQRAISLVLKMLECGAQSLHKLKVRLPLFEKIQNQWPIMTGVESIQLDMLASSIGFLQKFDLWSKFPNLKYAKLICQSTLLYWDEGGTCQISGVAINVRKIEFPCYFSSFPELPTVFPKLEQVTIDLIEDFRDLTKVWACVTLKTVELTLRLDRIHYASRLDSVFTGFSEETCKRLQQQEKSILNIVRMSPDSLRTRLSIVNLKLLQRLTIKIQAVKDSDKFPWVMSEVTGQYAFDYLPNLVGKVTICVELPQRWGHTLSDEEHKILHTKVWTALEDIAPYANIIDF